MNTKFKIHKSKEEAYNETKKEDIIACIKRTYIGEEYTDEYISFFCPVDYPTQEELEGFYPYSLGSNQVIIEIDQF